MGEMYINDIFGHHLPRHLSRLMNTAKLLTSQTNYEIMVAALEKYFNELGINNQAENRDSNGSPLNPGFQSLETGDFKYLYQKIRIKSHI